MLQAIRDRAQSWIAWVIVGLIILTFALFGIDQYARGDKVEVVAEVDGEDVTAREFLTMYNRQKQRLQKQFGDLYDQVVKDEELRNQVADALIESEQIRQWANQNDMVISDQRLAIEIQSESAFRQNGEFSQQVYEDILLRNGYNIARFEYETRQHLLESQYRNLTQSSSFATKTEIAKLESLETQERKVSYLRVDQRPFLKTVSVSDDEVKTEYDKNKDQFIEAEQVSIDYIELSQKSLASQVETDDDLLKGFFEENKLQFTLPEKRQAKHILITVDEVTSDEEAQKIVAEIQTKLKAGETFEELAKTYSKDPGSANSGGDLGTFEQGMMVPEFDDAVFSMKPDQVSEPVKTEFGYHLIKLVKIEDKQIQPFDTVKADVLQMYQMQEAERRYFDVLEQLNTLAYEQPDSLEPAADALGLKVNTSDFFSRSGGLGQILSNSKVINTAFSEDVLKSKMNSTSIDIATNHAVVIRVNKHKEARQRPLEEVAENLKEQLVRKAAIAESAKLGEQLLAEVNKGEQPESLMRDGVEWHTVGWIGRNSENLLPQMVNEAFMTPKPSDGKPSWKQFALLTGDTILMQVSEVKSGEFDAQQQAAVEDVVARLYAGAELSARMQSLREGSEVIKKENIKTLK
jgi:peptidyl-prolyl cis-trans isomerase D